MLYAFGPGFIPAFSGKDRVECTYSILYGAGTPNIFFKPSKKYRTSDAIITLGSANLGKYFWHWKLLGSLLFQRSLINLFLCKK